MIMFDRVSERCFVAIFTRYQTMFIFKDKTGSAMIKILHSFDCMERFLRMAFPAILAKLILVHVGVAIRTTGISQPGKFLELFSGLHFNFVTFGTINDLVFAGQLKLSPVMIEF